MTTQNETTTVVEETEEQWEARMAARRAAEAAKPRKWSHDCMINGCSYHRDPTVVDAAAACGATWDVNAYVVVGTFGCDAPLRAALSAIRARKDAESAARSRAGQDRTARQAAEDSRSDRMEMSGHSPREDH